MNYDFRPSPDFLKAVKALAKRYPSLKDDLILLRQSLEENPEQGVDLGGGLRKIRMNIRSNDFRPLSIRIKSPSNFFMVILA